MLIWQLAFLAALHVLPASLRTSAGTTKMSVSALRLVARPTGTAPLRVRPAKAGNRARTAPRASGKDEEESAGGIDYASLERRVLNLKKQELVGHTGHLPVVVLDATLPNQRLALRFDAKDVSRRMHAGTELGKMAEVGDKFAMLGLAPGSRQVLPLGTEVVLSRISPWPDGSGDVEIELIGSRRIRIEGQPFNENGVPTAKVRARHPGAFLNAEPSVQKAAGARTAFSVTKFSLSLSVLSRRPPRPPARTTQVTFMEWAPEDSPPSKNGEGVIGGAHPSASNGDFASGTKPYGFNEKITDGDRMTSQPNAAKCFKMAEDLEPLVDEWYGLVRLGGWERIPGQLDLIKSHIGEMPPREEPARRATWVASLINPIPALGVAYEIRPALLMARDTITMLTVATEGIRLSIERLRQGKNPPKPE